MAFRETSPAGILMDIIHPNRAFCFGDHADQAFTYGWVRYFCDLRLIHPHGDKAHNLPIIPAHTDGSIGCTGLLAGNAGNPMEQRFNRNILYQLQAGLVQNGQTFLELFAG